MTIRSGVVVVLRCGGDDEPRAVLLTLTCFSVAGSRVLAGRARRGRLRQVSRHHAHAHSKVVSAEIVVAEIVGKL